MTVNVPAFPDQVIEAEEGLDVEFWYPDLRYGPTKEYVRISLSHVRAADFITIRYDGVRDGWAIYMDKTKDADGYGEVVLIDEEVAFIPSWNEAE